MRNPWMSAWLRAMNTTLSATQAYWTGLMRKPTRGPKSDTSYDTGSKAASAPSPAAKTPAAESETSPQDTGASSKPANPPQTDSRTPETAPKEAAAATESASTRSAEPKKKAPPKKTAPPQENPERPAASKAKGGASAPKFQHPSDPSLTWSGRGRRPRWLTEALESGRTLDDLRVRKP